MRRLRWLVIAATAAGLLVGAAAYRHWNDPERLLERAEAELTGMRYEQAAAVADRVLRRQPDSIAARFVAARAALELEQYDEALAHLSQIPDDSRPEQLTGLGASSPLSSICRLSEAEATLRDTLDRDPHHVFARDRLAFILSLSGQRHAAAGHVVELIAQGRATMDHLFWLGNADRALGFRPLLETCSRDATDDPLPQLGLAKLDIFQSRVDSARERLVQIVESDPSLIEAQAQLGLILASEDTPEQFLAWNQNLPPAASDHPVTWQARATFARRRGEPRVAARCYGEALSRDPNLQRANYQLAQLLASLGEDKVDPFFTRAATLADLATALEELNDEVQHAPELKSDSLQKVVDLTFALGRYWEAWAWSQVAASQPSPPTWANERLSQIQAQLQPATPQTIAAANPVNSLDLAAYPLPSWSSFAVADSQRTRQATSTVTFEDSSRELGITFQYFNGADLSQRGRRMHEITGGGVGAIDYDGDLWPDLYFTQGSRGPMQSDGGQRDRLYRNLATSFEDVTDQAGLGDADFSQGVAVGDYNNDGFADLYVANIGRNRLYRNEGDGTFTDVTDEVGIRGEQWTVSAVIADLSGDGLPEIYDVNYLRGEDVFTRICTTRGVPVACLPTEFEGEVDQLHLNTGDSRFTNATEAAGLSELRGNGLGVVAADLSGARRLGLFVANDAVANSFLVRESGDALSFVDRATPSGLAADGQGSFQACMGVAAGDANGDSRLDLFATNYYLEANTLYQQEVGGTFFDASRTARLHDASYYQLGFGTQFLDADLDGNPDLVLTNGHIDDFSFVDQPYQMPAQFFRNTGSGQFEELAMADLGEYFQRKQLGRGLARLDWNRDGRADFAVSHVDTPAALVTNTTADVGNFVTVRLYGVTGSRDAVGTSVTVESGDFRRVRQLTAGDGYMASNERVLTFGLGERTKIDRISVRWLSGNEQDVIDVDAGQHIIIVEGREDAIVLE